MARRCSTLILLACWLLAGVVVCVLSGGRALAEKRVALVIGNANYVNVPKLPNPRNDAQDVAEKLRALEFDVVTGFDVGVNGWSTTLREFERKAANSDVAVFFYAGHALQHRGTNYLMSVDATLKDETDLNYDMKSLSDVRELLDRSNIRVKIIILDACRDNPLATQFSRTVMASTRGFGPTRGLARIDKPEGLIVVYATAAGQTADDGKSTRNSPFTSAFLNRLDEPGVEISDLFRRVMNDVRVKTNGRQQPEISVALADYYYLNRAETDAQAWQRADDSGEPEQVREFRRKYPKSRFVRDADRWLELYDLRQRQLADKEKREFAAAEEARRKAAEEAEKSRAAEDARRRADAEAKRRAEEDRRLAEERRKAEEARRQAEAAAERRQAEIDEARRQAEAVEAKKKAEEARRADEARKLAEAAEAKRRAEDARKAEEARKLAEAAEAKRRAEEVKVEEARRLAEAAEAKRKADEARKAEAARKQAEAAAEAKRLAEAAKAEEARKLAEAADAAEAKRKAEAARKSEAARKLAEAAEAKRLAEEAKKEEARKLAEAAEAQRKAEEARKADTARKLAEAAEANRRVEEARKVEEALRQAEAAAAKRRAQEEQQQIAAEKKAREEEERRLAEAKRQADELAFREQARITAEARKAEEGRLLAEKQARDAAERSSAELSKAQQERQRVAALERRRELQAIAVVALGRCMAASSTSKAVRTAAKDMDAKLAPVVRVQVQQLLADRGFFNGKADGAFTAATRTAISSFQQSIGSPKTGYLTSCELEALATSRE